MRKYLSGVLAGLLVGLSISAVRATSPGLLALSTATLAPSITPTVGAHISLSVSPETLNVGDTLTIKGEAFGFNSEQYSIALSSGGKINTSFEDKTVIQQTDALFDIVSATGLDNTVEVVLKARRSGTATVSISIWAETSATSPDGTPYFGFEPAFSNQVVIMVRDKSAVVGTKTPTFTPTLTPTDRPIPTQIPPVTANRQWTPLSHRVDGVEMVLVPPGCFTMGTANPPSSFADEQPATQVCFAKPFWIDKTDVTQAQFKQFGGTAESRSVYPSAFAEDQRPEDGITWFEARDFCTKRGARLPTEAEWEYVARGPDDLIYTWGNTFDGSKVVYQTNQTADVGSKPDGASWVGALDMSGNVEQWVSTLYKPYPYSKADGRESETDTTSQRVVRGGLWKSADKDDLRAAARDRVDPSFGIRFFLGFRCARS